MRTRQWAFDILRYVDPSGRLEAALPELVEPHQPVGRLRPELAVRLGLNSQAIVASGGGDNMMGAIGTDNIRPGAITMSLGTSGTLYAFSGEPRISPQPSVATFCSSSGGWLPLICTMNLTNANAAMRDLLELDLEAFNALVAQAPIGCEGVTMLPFLNGERVPALPQASASLHGLTADNLSRANLCRAVLEGVTFGLRYGLGLLRESGIRSERIQLIGGGAKNPLWRQIVADMMVPATAKPRNWAARSRRRGAMPDSAIPRRASPSCASAVSALTRPRRSRLTPPRFWPTSRPISAIGNW